MALLQEYPSAPKRNAFQSETQALFQALLAWQGDPPPRGQHPVPRQLQLRRAVSHRTPDLARGAWQARSPGDVAVRRNPAARDALDNSPDTLTKASCVQVHPHA